MRRGAEAVVSLQRNVLVNAFAAAIASASDSEQLFSLRNLRLAEVEFEGEAECYLVKIEIPGHIKKIVEHLRITSEFTAE